MKLYLFPALRTWIPLAFATTVVALLVLVSVQQVLRQGANDPQIEYAEDWTDGLNSGQPMPSLTPSIDIAQSLGSFAVIYDDTGKVLSTSAELGGKGLPALPAGVLATAKQSGESRITWQPQAGVREAVVIRPYSNDNQSGFVLIGRSLREVEKRESMLSWEVLAGWLAALIGSLALIMGMEWLRFPHSAN